MSSELCQPWKEEGEIGVFESGGREEGSVPLGLGLSFSKSRYVKLVLSLFL